MKREKIQRLDKAAREIVAANAQRWIATGTDKQKAQARQVLEDIASVEREEEESLVAQVAALSPAQRIVQAFSHQPPSETDAKVIRALLSKPGATSEQLSIACGWRKGSAWHLHFGKMCFDRRARLWPAPPAPHRGEDQYFYSGILALYDAATHGFTMKPEAAEAFAELKLG